MTSPMPRDSRGWIIYQWDRVRQANCLYPVLVLKVRESRLTTDLTDSRGIAVDPRTVTIDPDRSPSRTNYERWFADLGTREEVFRALHKACTDGCSDCPIKDWPETAYPGASCFSSFAVWIDEMAVRL